MPLSVVEVKRISLDVANLRLPAGPAAAASNRA
jgi:hypothetical protein